MQTITICTDAGYKRAYRQSCATWAAYIRMPSRTIKVSGILKQGVKSSCQAEIYGIANALHILNKQCDLSKYNLILYCDNRDAIRDYEKHPLQSKKQSSIELVKVYNKYILSYIKKANSYESRWVKAHLHSSKWSSNSARHFMQSWCDEEATRLRKIKEDQVKAKYIRLKNIA